MHKFMFVLIFLVFTNPAMATNYCNDANAVACWLFAEGSGTTVDDSTSNSNIGNFKASGEPVWDTTDISFAVSGVAPNSVDYDGGDDVIIVSSSASIDDLTAFTFIGWFKREGAGGASLSRFVNKGQMLIYLLESLRKVEVQINYSTTQAKSTSSTLYTNDAWTHLAATWNNAGDKKIRIYLDGAEVAYTTQTAGVGTPTSDTGSDLFLGNNSNDPGVRGLNGKQTDVGLFSRALSLSEIQEIRNYGLTGTGEVRERLLLLE